MVMVPLLTENSEQSEQVFWDLPCCQNWGRLEPEGDLAAAAEPEVISETLQTEGLPWYLSSKESPCHYRRHKFDPWSGKIPGAAE